MSSQSNAVEVRLVGEQLVAKIVGEEVLYQSSLITEIGTTLYDLAKGRGNKTMIVNLQNVKYASTELLAKLLSLNSRVERERGRLKLCCLHPDVHNSLRILKILRCFDVAESEQEALGSPQRETATTTAELSTVPKPAHQADS